MSSLLGTWTIPTDPGFQTRRSERDVVREFDYNRGKPRVKPEAMSIALKSQGSVAQLFNPNARQNHTTSTKSVRSERKRDFVKENARQIRRIEKSNQESGHETLRSIASEKSTKVDKYEHVESKVAQEVKGNPQAPRSQCSSFLKKHSRCGSPVYDKPATTRALEIPANKLAVPRVRSESLGKSKEEQSPTKVVNHVSKNIRQATSSPVNRHRAPSTIAAEQLEKKKHEDERKYKRGHVPSYLRKRQQQWKDEADERARNLPDPDLPPGHTLMPRDEREQTLDLLRKKHSEMTSELNSLPVSCDTLRIKNRKTELEKKLREIENAIKIFSRPKVFVKTDS